MSDVRRRLRIEAIGDAAQDRSGPEQAVAREEPRQRFIDDRRDQRLFGNFLRFERRERIA